jgi:lipid-A-disaccharide synthase
MKYYIIAGEASGDLHASNLVKSIYQQDKEAVIRGFGGDLMQNEGVQLVKHYRELAFMGFIPVLLNIRTIFRNLNLCKQDISDFKPDVVILIDYPGFNLKIAKFAKTILQLPVFYYIPPKLWAWKEYRIKDIKKFVDKVFTIFPFETDFYAKHQCQVQYVGNPSVESVQTFQAIASNRTQFILENALDEKRIIAILPGSRKQELEACLPIMLQVDFSKFADYQFVVAATDALPCALYRKLMQGSDAKIVYGKTYDLLQHADVAIVTSGTATLETALFNVPQVVCYEAFLSWLVAPFLRLILKIKYVSLVNIIAQKELVKELLIHDFTPLNTQNELHKLVFDQAYRNAMLQGYAALKTELGTTIASDTAAHAMIAFLQKLKRG